MILLIGAFVLTQTLVRRDRVDVRRSALALGAVTVPFLLFLSLALPDRGVRLRDGHGGGATFRLARGLARRSREHEAGVGDPRGRGRRRRLALRPARERCRHGRAPRLSSQRDAGWSFSSSSSRTSSRRSRTSMSISQGRRFLFYLPFAFALTGGALVLARFRYFAVAGRLRPRACALSGLAGRFHVPPRAPGPVGSPGSPRRRSRRLRWCAAKQDVRYGNVWAARHRHRTGAPGGRDRGAEHEEVQARAERVQRQPHAAVDQYVTRDESSSAAEDRLSAGRTGPDLHRRRRQAVTEATQVQQPFGRAPQERSASSSTRQAPGSPGHRRPLGRPVGARPQGPSRIRAST